MTRKIRAVIGGTVLTAFLVLAWRNRQEYSPLPEQHRTVKADITAGRTTLTVINRDEDKWEAKQLFINGMPPFTYRLWIDPLGPGQATIIPLSDFTKKNGERFQPDRFAVTEIWIGGNGFDYTSYRIR